VKIATEVKGNPQLDFFDAGLLPVLADFFQIKLKDLLERTFRKVANRYLSIHNEQPSVAFLFPYLFRFVTAKIFMDRADSRGWQHLKSPLEVLQKAEAHSGSGLLSKLPKEFLHPSVMEEAWMNIARSFHFQNLSVPDLAFIYESSFINESNRKDLGIHSTPLGLAGYLVQHIPWETLPVNSRRIFEPFCGHGIFLASAMERLREDLPSSMSGKDRHKYFQRMLVGVEKDPLAIEVCRLVLTLSDYPNANSWELYQDDVFAWPDWKNQLSSASVVLSNPPYEHFSSEGRESIQASKATPPAELIHRIMSKPPAVLGLILPQSFLTSPLYQDANRRIASNYAEVSIVELPRIFRYADNETIALIACERKSNNTQVRIQYSEVSIDDTDSFYQDFRTSKRRSEDRILAEGNEPFTLWISSKEDLWDHMKHLPRLEDVGTIRKGLSWKRRKDGLSGRSDRQDVASDEPKVGFHIGAEKMAGNLTQFSLTRSRYLSLRNEDQDPRTNAHANPWHLPKVVCNAARLRRHSPWRIAAWADSEGLAFTNVYFAIWPKRGVSEYALAAVLNSPVANAFSFSRDLDKHNHIATLKALPVPETRYLLRSGQLHKQAKKLQSLLREPARGTAAIAEQLLRLDAAVLDAYELPDVLQRRLLDIFHDTHRPVLVNFPGYFPDHFKDCVSLSDLIRVQYDWDSTNERRCELIKRSIAPATMSTDESVELKHLQDLADLLIRLKAPYPDFQLEDLVSRLRTEER
jgi:type I restriction-modification system DNA methylase subunit